MGRQYPLYESLQRLRSDPTTNNKHVSLKLRAPAVFYIFNDGSYRIAYQLSYLPDEEVHEVAIYSIERVV